MWDQLRDGWVGIAVLLGLVGSVWLARATCTPATPVGQQAMTLPSQLEGHEHPDAAGRSIATWRHLALLAAIRAVETGGEADPATAEGAAGEVGPYQITEAYWHDACEHAGWLGDPAWAWPEAARDRQRSELVMVMYWDRYGADTDEERARMHNGGPAGATRAATRAYWMRVREMMRRQEAGDE